MNLKGIKLTWLGHATFRIETPGGKTVIIDRWVMEQTPKRPDSEKRVEKVDILLCTHGHGDHIVTPSKSPNSTTRPWSAFPSCADGWARKV